MANLLLHSDGQNCSGDFRLRCRECRSTQDLTRAVDEVELILGAHIHTDSVPLEAAIKKYVELTVVVEDNLPGKGDVLGEEDLVHGRTKYFRSLFGQDGRHGT